MNDSTKTALDAWDTSSATLVARSVGICESPTSQPYPSIHSSFIQNKYVFLFHPLINVVSRSPFLFSKPSKSYLVPNFISRLTVDYLTNIRMDDKPIPPMTTASNDPAMTTASNDPAMTTSTNDTEEFAMDITRASPAPTPPNLPQWNANSDYWDRTLGDGNSMFTELILPTIEELAELKPGQKVLDLGTGNGIVARRLADAQTGVEILACDYSEQQLHNAQKRTDAWYKVRAARGILDESKIEFERLDLLDRQALHNFASLHPRCVFIFRNSPTSPCYLMPRIMMCF